MITLNLLPDVKKQYLNAQRKKRLFIMGALVIIIASASAVVLMSMYTFGVQKLQISNSQKNIDASIKTLKETPDLAKVVTVQNQLKALPALHDEKPAAYRLFNFFKVLIPNDVSLSSATVNFEDQTMELKGTSKDFKSTNTFVDTLKNAEYTYADNQEKTLAFSDVVLGSIGKGDDTAAFKITFSYDPLIFDNTITGLKLTVPNITSSRSVTEKPNSLFDNQGTGEEEGK